MEAPKLTDTQRAEAREKSLATRRARAEIKRQIREGELDLDAAVLLEPAQGMKVMDLIRAIKGIGPHTAPEILDKARIGYDSRVRSLGHLQLSRLLSLF